MRVLIDHNTPPPTFWTEYRELWSNSQYRPAFQAPAFLKFLVEYSESEKMTYCLFRGEKLAGATLFEKRGPCFRFLSDVKSIQNFFVLREDLPAKDISLFFEEFATAIKKNRLSILLDKQPVWAGYTHELIQAAQRSKLICHSVPLAVCPVLELANGAEIASFLNRSGHLRKKVNQMFSRHDVGFEVLRSDQDLDAWLESYFYWHQQRWKNTPTPSRYYNTEERNIFAQSLRAWIADEVAVRFAFRKATGERIALCIGLLQAGTLLDYYMVYDPAYAQYSPSKGLLPFIGKWMEEEGLNILDMGYGDYPYKHEYTNNEFQLERVYLSGNINLPFLLQAKTDKIYRQHPGMLHWYRKFLKPMSSPMRKRNSDEKIAPGHTEE